MVQVVTRQLGDFNKLIENISMFKRARLPGVLAGALNRTATYLKVQEADYMGDTFNSAGKLTRSAPMTSKWAKKEKLEFNFFLRDDATKGNAPANYLAPQVYGGQVMVTRFNKRLRRKGVIGENQFVPYWVSSQPVVRRGAGGKVTPGFLQQVASSLGGLDDIKKGKNKKTGREYFTLGLDEGNRTYDFRVGDPYQDSQKEDGYEGPGIYFRRKNSDLALVFRVIDKVPTVAKKYDWSIDRLRKVAEKQFSTQVLVGLKNLWG
jgi:hypothetical protein